MKRILLGLALATFTMSTLPAKAGDIVDEWASVKAPPPPALKPVTVDPKTTALLVLDMIKPICNAERYPRCLGTVAVVKKLIGEARAKGMMVVYTSVPNVPVTTVLEELAAKPGEPFFQSGTDKFLKTDLEKMLRDKGVTTVISTGVAAQGAVISTASEASLRGFKVIVPIDTISGNFAYPEQYTVWHLANGPVISPNITVTKLDLMKF